MSPSPRRGGFLYSIESASTQSHFTGGTMRIMGWPELNRDKNRFSSDTEGQPAPAAPTPHHLIFKVMTGQIDDYPDKTNKKET